MARETTDREAFQEIDYRRMFGQMAKWVAQIEDARRIPELISQAFHTALNGRPGPVVLALPEDMLVDEVEVRRRRPLQDRPRRAGDRRTWRRCASCSQPPRSRW